MVLLFAGCSSEPADSLSETDGGDGYEVRLQATAEEFAYYSLLDANLTETSWEGQGVSLRVPMPFELVSESTPQIPAREHAGSREILGKPLPGVLGMWKAELPSRNSGPPQSGYLFLMSNHHPWPRSRTSAMEFHQTLVEEVLAELPGLSVLPIESDWKPENIAGHGLPYTVGNFEATLPQTNSPAWFTMFLFQHGVNQRRDEIKVALLFVIPKEAELAGSHPNVDPQTLSAQTLRIIPRPMDQF
jgi:hypothetical protein